MKKLVLVLLVAMLSVPAFAANPVITLVPVTSPANSGEVDVMYTADLADANLLPSGFGLTVAVNSGAKITMVKNLNADFDIYPGSIDINDATGLVDNVGSPVVGAVPTAADGSIILEMGALYKRGVDTPPAKSGKLCTIKVDKTCTVTVTGNDARCGTGMGIVAQNLVAYPVSSGPVQQLVTIATAPACTLAAHWKQGDVAGGPPTLLPDGKVDTKDLNLIIKASNWGKNTTDHPTAPGTADICADIIGGPPTLLPDKKVDSKDLNVVIKAANWGCPTSAGCTW